MPENGPSGSMWREPETEMTVRSSGTFTRKGRKGEGSQDLQHPPRRLPTRLGEVIRGSAVMFGGNDTSKGTSSFELRPYQQRFQGVGTREYPRADQRCTLGYDVLLKCID